MSVNVHSKWLNTCRVFLAVKCSQFQSFCEKNQILDNCEKTEKGKKEPKCSLLLPSPNFILAVALNRKPLSRQDVSHK